ncbi:hypothetical protein [Methylocystis heyeri]|uniref:Uncharacterized protein n=1 Tax=Methylocystis heyeri TaxID=391905 RepID=A0A6B8KG75_9HYPH|nr:hypothetical protein [Methylocystis heyeri]QGM45548.1 hypothetical protein H2LOC_007465 [Methylocystis heyeri]
MLGFEIWKNGRKVAVAGLEDSGAVSLMLTWVGKGALASSRAVEGSGIDGLDLRVGGIDTSDPLGDQSVEWIEDTEFRLGDEIQVRLVSVAGADAPMRREPTRALLAGEAGYRFAPCSKCGGVRLRERAVEPDFN